MDAYKTLAQVFEAKPIRQVKADSCWKRQVCYSDTWNCDPGYTCLFFTCPAAQEMALVLFLQWALCWVSCCSRFKCIAEGLPRVPWLSYSCHMTNIGACPHTGQQWRVRHLMFTLAISQTKNYWFYMSVLGLQSFTVANLPPAQSIWKDAKFIANYGESKWLRISEKYERHRVSQIPCLFHW